MLKKFLQDETGAELAEYAVGVALLVAIGIVVYKVLGRRREHLKLDDRQQDQDCAISVKSAYPTGAGWPLAGSRPSILILSERSTL